MMTEKNQNYYFVDEILNYNAIDVKKIAYASYKISFFENNLINFYFD
jgi:hypothetical protein